MVNENCAQQTPRLLVVDDESLNRKYYVQVLKRKKYTIDEASSGEEALECIENHNYDVILSDLQMYKVGGLDVLHVAKEKDPHTQVVIITGFASIPTAVKAMQQGAFDYLSKPVNKDDLILRVEKALQQRALQKRIEQQRESIEAFNLLLQRDLQLAENVQNSLVPSDFENDFLAVGIEYHPMIGIGGDFCSITRDEKDHVNVNIIDVTGHGIAAALIVNRVYTELRAILRHDPQPKDVLSDINTFFYNTFENMGLFLTIFSARIDFEHQEITYSGGAHPPALLYNPQQNNLKQLPSQNTIVGFEKNPTNPFIQHTLQFTSKDRLILYTDGILEAENSERTLFGMGGLRRSLQKHIRKPVARAAGDIIKDVRSFCSDSLRDDIMLMILELK